MLFHRRKYKKNDLLSIIGLGGISIKGLGLKNSSNLISYAYDNGVNYFDVAPGYGDAQELMGEGLRSYRKNVFLACKTKYRNQLDSTNDLNNSLKLLKTDYFDLYQLHGMKTYNDYQNVVSKDGALKTLIEAKEKGKVRYIGFSCHSIEVAKLLINEELQLYALDIGEESSIGSLNDIITDLPDGFGSSIFQEDAYLGILVRNDFDNIGELKDQFELLKSNENTALLLLPIEEIDFQNNDGEFRIYGSFGELFDTENEIINQSGYENVFDGKLGFKVPGEITKPNINNIVENTIIFEADGVSSKTFELVSSNDRPLNPINIAIAFVVLTAVYFFVRQSRKTK